VSATEGDMDLLFIRPEGLDTCALVEPLCAAFRSCRGSDEFMLRARTPHADDDLSAYFCDDCSGLDMMAVAVGEIVYSLIAA
jgi:hypothetical protein